MADRVGQQLGDYRLIRSLDAGSSGEVYLGEHIYLQTQAAIKVLHVRLEADELQGFLNVARRVATLNHPHIVRLLGFSVEKGTPFMVMQLAPRGTLLSRYPRKQRFPIETILPHVKQVAEGLQYAHDRKIIHLDIKPENMLLGEQDEVLLSDFGVAAVLQQTKSHLTVRGFSGTAAYAAPEQFQNQVGPASDQYALAVVVYEWLTGELPFFRDNLLAIGMAKAQQEPPPLRAKVPSISPTVEWVVLRALSRDPKDRYPTVRAFAERLAQASQDRPAPFIDPSLYNASTVQTGNRPASFGAHDAPTAQSVNRDKSQMPPAPAADMSPQGLAERLKDKHDLGEFIPQEYPLRHTSDQVSFAILLALGGIALILYQTGLFSPSHSPPSSLSDALLACAIGIVLIILALVLIRTAPNAHYDRLYLFDRGLVRIEEKRAWKDLRGKEMRRKEPTAAAMRWKDVTVRWKIPKREGTRKINERSLSFGGLDLESYEQREFTYNRGYDKFEGLVRAIENRLIDAKRSRAIEKYERGEQLEFDAIALSATGIRSEGRSPDWKDVVSIDFSENYTLIIKIRNTHDDLPPINQEDIRDVCILEALFEYIQPAKGYKLKPRKRS